MPCSVERAGTTPPLLCFVVAERHSSPLNDLPWTDGVFQAQRRARASLRSLS